MNNRIQILPPHEAQKIAAGEVVERPASVLKELLENALDAGATKLILFFEKTGIDRIRVVDNGCGMGSTDAQSAFLSHATSKIRSVSDLAQLTTFGFRGEALASITAAAKEVLLRSRSSEDEIGTLVHMQGMECVRVISTGCPIGTDITVEHLFEHMPARKKFLKHDDTEWNQIRVIIDALCLGNPALDITVYRDDMLILRAPTCDGYITRMLQLWGRELERHLTALIPLHDIKRGVLVGGVISDQQWWRYNRNQMVMLVNKRVVKNTALSKSILEGYRNILPPARFPTVLLDIQIDSSEIDVNVHPRKEEVQFSHPKIVESLVKQAVHETLGSIITRTISGLPTQPVSTGITPKSNNSPKFDQAPPHTVPTMVAYEPSQAHDIGSRQAKPSHLSIHTQLRAPAQEAHIAHRVHKSSGEHNVHTPISQSLEQNQVLVHSQHTVIEKNQPIRIIGQLLATYILLDTGKELTIIDQHAAHERIMYERIVAVMTHQEKIALLFPTLISCEQQKREKILIYRAEFETIGITLEEWSETHLAVMAVPAQFQHVDMREIVKTAIDFLEDSPELDTAALLTSFRHELIAKLACNAALKGGEILSIDQMERIASDLARCHDRMICAHGRPTSWTISHQELERWFQRKL